MGATATQHLRQTRMITGTYLGDGNDDRTIDIGVDLFHALRHFIIIKARTNRVAVHSAVIFADSSQYFDANVDFANAIQAVTTSGFTIGNDVTVNAIGENYRYVVFWENP